MTPRRGLSGATAAASAQDYRNARATRRSALPARPEGGARSRRHAPSPAPRPATAPSGRNGLRGRRFRWRSRRTAASFAGVDEKLEAAQSFQRDDLSAAQGAGPAPARPPAPVAMTVAAIVPEGEPWAAVRAGDRLGLKPPAIGIASTLPGTRRTAGNAAWSSARGRTAAPR